MCIFHKEVDLPLTCILMLNRPCPDGLYLRETGVEFDPHLLILITHAHRTSTTIQCMLNARLLLRLRSRNQRADEIDTSFSSMRQAEPPSELGLDLTHRSVV